MTLSPYESKTGFYPDRDPRRPKIKQNLMKWGVEIDPLAGNPVCLLWVINSLSGVYQPNGSYRAYSSPSARIFPDLDFERRLSSIAAAQLR